jgi:tripartite-type tricarboxylate transporter receptor subunit TctC
LYDALKVASGTAVFRQRALSEGLIVTMDTPDATTAFVRSEETKWRRVVKEQSIKAE